MKSLYALLSMLIRENFISGSFERVPEDSLVMDSLDQADAWHRQGAEDGPIVPVYHLVAQACSSLAPVGSTVIDLGCGSGQFAAYLARHRPDLRIVGIDLSGPMIEIGNQGLREGGLADRVELRQGDMTTFSQGLPEGVGLINCLFAIHHLPSLYEVKQCFEEIRQVSDETGCSIMLFDLAKPRHTKTAIDYPKALTPNAPDAFRLDSVNSLLAAYSYKELVELFTKTFGVANVSEVRSRILPLYQAFWREGSAPEGMSSQGTHKDLPASSRHQFAVLRSLFPKLARL